MASDYTRLDSTFLWAQVALQKLTIALGGRIRNTALCTARSFSSHCSGSGAAELAPLSFQLVSDLCIVFVFLGGKGMKLPCNILCRLRLSFIRAAATCLGLQTQLVPTELCALDLVSPVLHGWCEVSSCVFDVISCVPFKFWNFQEKDPMCQHVLSWQHGGSCHLVGDIFSRFEHLQNFPDPSAIISNMDVQQAAKYLNSLQVAKYVPCQMHNCICWMPSSDNVDVDVTGSPCQDYSMMGSRSGFFGKQYPILHAWLLWVICVQPRIAPLLRLFFHS